MGLFKNKIISTVENLNLLLTASFCFVDVIFSGPAEDADVLVFDR